MAAEATIRSLRKLKGWKTISSLRSLAFSSGNGLPSSQPLLNCLAEELMPKSEKKLHKPFVMFPALLIGAFGLGALHSHADAHEADHKRWAALGSPSDFSGMEKIVSQERQRLEELLRRKGLARGSYPSYTVAVKGHQISIKFPIPQTCKKSHLIAYLVSHLGPKKTEDQGGGAQMMLHSWDSAVAWQLTLSYPQKQIEIDRNEECPSDKDTHDSSLCILIFESLISSDKAEIEFIKQESFSMRELEAVVSALRIAGGSREPNRPVEGNPRGVDRDRRDSRSSTMQEPSIEKSLSALEAMGVRVFGLERPFGLPVDECGVSWENIAGYHEQKRDIEDTILLALQNPEVYDAIAHGTRFKFESNRPRAVLFEGPPGTGKTSCARVIATQAGVPLLYVPLEIVMSKYYGESERLLGQVFSLANDIPNGAIIFLDEVDSFAATRDSEMHEATRRILSVLLRQIDGFEQDKRVVVVAATNRKQDLDPALISRFDSLITFGLPDQQTREEIAAQYARHLNKSELAQFAVLADGMSGRDIRDACQQAERRWASKIIRGNVPDATEQGRLPPIQEYLECAEQRRKALSDISEKKSLKETSGALSKKQPLALA